MSITALTSRSGVGSTPGRVTADAPAPADAQTVMVTQVGLRMPPLLSYQRWELTGRRMAEVASSSAWCLGDWIIYGQSRYTDRYRHAIDVVGLDYQTIRNYAWVARRFSVDRRRAALSFQHHAEVASLPPSEQDHWLDRAEKSVWSRNELRRAVRAARTGQSEPSAEVALPRMRADSDRIDRWRRAAELAEHPLEAWILSCLDAQANAVLGEDRP